MKTIKITIKKTPEAKDLPLPSYKSSGASGLDLSASVKEPVTLLPGEIKLIPTGLSVEIPLGFEAQVRPRSGLALKHGVTLVNTPGTIDSDYRGEIALIMTNLGTEPYIIHRGARLAQMIIAEVIKAEIEEVQELSATVRGEGGFGHTGVHG